MIAAEVLDAMLQAGCTAEQIVAAVKADAAIEAEKAARQIPWPKLRAMAFERDGHLCGYCSDTEGPFEVDHIKPKADGGEDILENVTVACRSCNRAKRDRQGEDWAQLRDRRAADRERKRRERSGQPRKSRNVTRTEVDNTLDKKGPHTPKKINPNPPPISPQFCDRIVESWNLAASRCDLPSARKLNTERCTKLRRRLKSFTEAEMLEAITKLASSPFHCGENDRGWKADIGWLLKSDENVTKALEIRPKATSPPVDPLVAKILARESAVTHWQST